jgi:inhibitor of KinA sporulation pathway (predicted exonuclease)
MTLANPINNTLDIYNNILILFDKLKKEEKFRSIGIRLGDLDTKNVEQVSLFNNKNDDNIQNLLDDINSKYKNTVVMPAIFYEKEK